MPVMFKDVFLSLTFELIPTYHVCLNNMDGAITAGACSKHYILHLASSTGLASNKNNYCQITLKCSFYCIKNKVQVSVVQFTSKWLQLELVHSRYRSKILLDSQVNSLIKYEKSFTDSFKWLNQHLTYWTIPKYIKLSLLCGTDKHLNCDKQKH